MEGWAGILKLLASNYKTGERHGQEKGDYEQRGYGPKQAGMVYSEAPALARNEHTFGQVADEMSLGANRFDPMFPWMETVAGEKSMMAPVQSARSGVTKPQGYVDSSRADEDWRAKMQRMIYGGGR